MILSVKTFLLVWGASLILVGCAKHRPPTPGGGEARLKPCPASPNCVSSQSTDRKHRVEPLAFEGDPADALARLKTLVQSMERTRIVDETSTYLHVECRSALVGFVDDVEFSIDVQDKVIHLRSASRTGYWDMGVNRRRIEAIRAQWSGD
jgi:uncharacterized protein (DUF1499 family)